MSKHCSPVGDAGEIARTLVDADVVHVAYPNGDRTLLKGEALLKRIIASGENEEVNMAFIPVATDDEATLLAAAMKLIDKNQFGPDQFRTFQAMLTALRNGFKIGPPSDG